MNKKFWAIIAILTVATVSGVTAYTNYYSVSDSHIDATNSIINATDSNATITNSTIQADNSTIIVGENNTVIMPSPEPTASPTPSPSPNPIPTPEPTPPPIQHPTPLVNPTTVSPQPNPESNSDSRIAYFDGSYGRCEFLNGANINITYYYCNASFTITYGEKAAQLLWENLDYANYKIWGGEHNKAYWAIYPSSMVAVGWCYEVKSLRIQYNGFHATFSLAD